MFCRAVLKRWYYNPRICAPGVAASRSRGAFPMSRAHTATGYSTCGLGAALQLPTRHRTAAAGRGAPRHCCVGRTNPPSSGRLLPPVAVSIHYPPVENAARPCPCPFALCCSSCSDVRRTNPVLAGWHDCRRTAWPPGRNIPVACAASRQSSASGGGKCRPNRHVLARGAGRARSTAIGVGPAPGPCSAAPVPCLPCVCISLL